MKNTTLENILQLANKMVRNQKFLDPKIGLKKYNIYHFKEYIQFCCDKKYYIEAYSLAVQYVEDLILTFIKPENNSMNANHVGIIMHVLNRADLIPDNIHSRYISAKETRNILARKIINVTNKIEKLEGQNPDSHAKNLLLLITSMEDVFISLFTKVKKSVGEKNAKQQTARVVDILMERKNNSIKERIDKTPTWKNMDTKEKGELLKSWNEEELDKIQAEFIEKL